MRTIKHIEVHPRPYASGQCIKKIEVSDKTKKEIQQQVAALQNEYPYDHYVIIVNSITLKDLQKY